MITNWKQPLKEFAVSVKNMKSDKCDVCCLAKPAGVLII
jgi:hypothetical protein